MIEVTTAALADQPFLSGMSREHLSRLAEAATIVVIPAGQRIFEDGGNASRFWLIRSGRAALDFLQPGEGPVVVETLGMGDVLGWSWLFPPYRWVFGAVAVTPTEAFQFDGPAVRALMDADPGLGYELTRRFIAVVANRLQATRFRLVNLRAAPEPQL